MTTKSRTLVLVGVKHTGKSLVAKLISARTGWRVIDTDDLVKQLCQTEFGRRLNVRDIYRLDGGQTFRSLEVTACAAALNTNDSVVVAAGGGVCDNVDAMNTLNRGTVVALDDDADTLFARVTKHGVPAFLSGGSPQETRREFNQLHNRRSALYREMAGIVVSVRDLSPDQVAARVIGLLEENQDGRQ